MLDTNVHDELLDTQSPLKPAKREPTDSVALNVTRRPPTGGVRLPNASKLKAEQVSPHVVGPFSKPPAAILAPSVPRPLPALVTLTKLCVR